jgi:predicted Rossmann-fold nucleotide-binding protein
MPHARIPTVEIESLDQFDAHLEQTDSIGHWAIQSVDLTERGATLAGVDVAGAIFLGCTMPRPLEDDLTDRGALVFPPIPHVSFNPYRGGLYTAEELYNGIADGPYSAVYDARVYAWYRSQSGAPLLPASLAMGLHDQAIGDALDDLLSQGASDRLVGVMGGHGVRRADPGYKTAAHLGLALADAGWGVATGGGPGAMEAVNLGARLATGEELDETIAALSAVPDFHHDIAAWVRPALKIADAHPGRCINLGIPTWFYGHEPPNALATSIAKFFSNALREDVLLSRCHGGLIVLPGAAGTVQEIFQCATRNYYAATADLVTPLVLVGHDYWTNQLPAWGLLEALSAGRPMGDKVHLVDTVQQAIAALSSSGSKSSRTRLGGRSGG